MRMLGLLLGLVLPVSAWGQIDLSAEYKPHTPIEAKCTSVVPDGAKATYRWNIRGAQYVTIDNGRRCFVWAPPGEYVAELIELVITVDWTAQTFDVQQNEHRQPFRVQGGQPEPPPPPPVPDALSGVIIIEETSGRTSGIAGVLQDIRQKGLPGVPASKLWLIDKDQTQPPEWNAWISYIGGKSLPYLIGVDGTDKVVLEGGLPPTYDDVVAMLR